MNHNQIVTIPFDQIIVPETRFHRGGAQGIRELRVLIKTIKSGMTIDLVPQHFNTFRAHTMSSQMYWQAMHRMKLTTVRARLFMHMNDRKRALWEHEMGWYDDVMHYHPFIVNHDWNGGALQKMAHTIFEEREFGRMPVLADALEESGLADPAVLNHCRSNQEHARGCWVIDRILGEM